MFPFVRLYLDLQKAGLSPYTDLHIFMNGVDYSHPKAD